MKRNTINRKKVLFLLVTLVPAFGFYFLFTLWPNLMSVYYSLLDWNGISPPKFVGIKNFISLMGDKFVWNGLWHNVQIMLVVVPATMIIALLLAFALTNTKFRENKFYQALFYFPNVMPVVVVALLWSFIYDGDMGLLSGLLELFTSKFEGKYWLADKNLALICIMIPMIWCNVGFHTVIYINAMLSIPKSLYESADLGGATMLQKLRYITIPLMRETLVTSATFLILNAFQGFELIMLMTNGGPSGATSTISMYMYTLAFGSSNTTFTRMYGYSSAVGMLLMVVLMTIRYIMGRFTKGEAIQY